MTGILDKDKLPNEGLKKLAEEAPEVVKKMGFKDGGVAIMIAPQDEMQDAMEEAEPMKSDEQMENDYLDFVVEESLSETEERYLTGVESNIIEGAEQFVRENASNIDNPLNAIALNYRNIFDTMLNAAENVGFINNRPAFYMFKKQLQRELGKASFTADQHKFIDKTLFLDLMTRPESPFVQSKLISKDTFNALYTNPSKNIIT